MRVSTRILTLIALATACVQAVAHDLTPPPWRGAPGSTFQHWMYNQPQTGNWVPEIFQQTPPLPEHPYMVGPGTEWLPTFEGMSGVISILPGSSVRFFLPNYNMPSSEKLVRVQLTWFSSLPGTTVVPPSGVEYGGSVTTAPIPGTPWMHSTVDFHLPECPSFEITVVKNLTTAPIYLDQVVIDTLCNPVPEPATIAALGVGVVAVIRRRKRA